jgi:hypothetical protein
VPEEQGVNEVAQQIRVKYKTNLRLDLDLMKAVAEIDRLEAELQRFRGALTPTAETKAAYIGEFSFTTEEADILCEHGETYPVKRTVPWDTIKDIMKAIRTRGERA